MYVRKHLLRWLSPLALLAALSTLFALPTAVPAHAAIALTVGGDLYKNLSPSDRLANNQSIEFQVDVVAGTQVIIGALNLGAPSTNQDLKITDLQCPGDSAHPDQIPANGRSGSGVVFCRPRDNGHDHGHDNDHNNNNNNDRNDHNNGHNQKITVTFKVKNNSASTVDYGVFVKATSDTVNTAPLRLPGDLRSRGNSLRTSGVQLYSVQYAAGFDHAKFVLQYAPVNTKMIAHIYDTTNGDQNCNATLAAQSQINSNPTLDPALVSRCRAIDHSDVFVIVVNYVGETGNYCLYLAPREAPQAPSNLVLGPIDDC